MAEKQGVIYILTNVWQKQGYIMSTEGNVIHTCDVFIVYYSNQIWEL